MEVVGAVGALVCSFKVVDEHTLKVGPTVDGSWWEPIQPYLCRPREAERHVSEGIANIAEPMVRL